MASQSEDKICSWNITTKIRTISQITATMSRIGLTPLPFFAGVMGFGAACLLPEPGEPIFIRPPHPKQLQEQA